MYYRIYRCSVLEFSKILINSVIIVIIIIQGTGQLNTLHMLRVKQIRFFLTTQTHIYETIRE